MNADIEQKWILKLDELGTEVVKSKLNNPNATRVGSHAKVAGVVAFIDGDNETLTANRQFCEDWLAKKDQSAQRRSNQIFWLTAVGALAAVVAAIASILALSGN